MLNKKNPESIGELQKLKNLTLPRVTSGPARAIKSKSPLSQNLTKIVHFNKGW